MLMGRLDVWMKNQIRTTSLTSHPNKLQVESDVKEELRRSSGKQSLSTVTAIQSMLRWERTSKHKMPPAVGNWKPSSCPGLERVKHAIIYYSVSL